jgi:predicted CopG family antitoxin
MKTTTIRISEKLWKYLNDEKTMGESFEDVIWRHLLKNPKLARTLKKKSVGV